MAYRLFYESEIENQSEQQALALSDKQAWLNNHYVFEKIVDKTRTNVILLGSKSGKFTGEFEDLAIYEWDGGNLQGFDFGRKGSGKSVDAMNWGCQMAFMYNLPVIAFDRAGEYVSHPAPLQDSKAIQNLRAFGLQPLGFGARQKIISPGFLENKDLQPWDLGLPDYLKIKPPILAKNLVEKLLEISGDTESEQSKYTAGRRYLELAWGELSKKPTFEELFAIVREINENLPSKLRSDVLEDKLRQVISSGYATGKNRVDFKTLIQKRFFVDFVTSLKLSKHIPLQVFEAWLHNYIFQLKKDDEIPPVFVISEEHDLVSNRGAEKNILKEVYKNIATKERKQSNIYFKITQMPTFIPTSELQQSDFMITTRPRDPAYCDVFRWINEDVDIKAKVMALPWDDVIRPVPHALITSNKMLVYSGFASWSQYHKENKRIWLAKAERTKGFAI